MVLMLKPYASHRVTRGDDNEEQNDDDDDINDDNDVDNVAC